MRPQLIALLLGGVVPAFLFGISGICQKTSARAGIGTGPYLVIVGGVVALLGAVFMLIEHDTTWNRQSAIQTCLFGLFWGLGIASIAIALGRFGGQISQLVPLYNMNTLVAVLIGLFLMSEWRDVIWGRLLLSSVLIVAGGVLAATSSK